MIGASSRPNSKSDIFGFVSTRRASTVPSSLLPWMQQNRFDLAPDKPFDLESHKYLHDLYTCTRQSITVYKSAQMGVSEYLISSALFACDRLNASVLYIFPTGDAVGDFSTARLGPAIESSAYLSQLVSGASGVRGADRIKLKRVGNGFLYFRGSTVNKDGRAPQLKSIDADGIIIDEVDECDPRSIPLARMRLGHSVHKMQRFASTPSYSGTGIHALWSESDKRVWMIPCPSCNHRQNVTIDNIVQDWDELGRPTAWHGQQDSIAFACCKLCNKALDLSVDGEWVAEYPSVEPAGFHVTKLLAPWTNILDIVTNLQSTNETKRRETTNQDLGLPYKPRGISITPELMDSLKREYAHSPRRERPCVMGIDVGSVLHVVVREAEHPGTGERAQLFAGTVPDFDDVHGLIKLFQPIRVVCDALPETKSARAMQDEHKRGLVWLCYYNNLKEGSKKKEPCVWNRTERTVLADRTRTLDETVARFVDQVNTVPAHIDDIDDYVAQVCEQVRVKEPRPDGSEIVRYVNSGPDHYGHAENYCTIASLGKPLSRMA